MTTRNARDKLDNICNESTTTSRQSHRVQIRIETKPEGGCETAGGEGATRLRDGTGARGQNVSNRNAYTMDTGQRIPIQIRTHTHADVRSFMLVHSLVRPFRFCVPAYKTVYPTFQFNLYFTSVVDISDPSFFAKYYLQHL